MKYNLIKKEDVYRDKNDCIWNSKEDWFISGVLELCGCGYEQEDRIIPILMALGIEDYGKRWDKVQMYKSEYGEFYVDLVLKLFDIKEITEHGTSVNGSWLTKEGENVYNILKENKE